MRYPSVEARRGHSCRRCNNGDSAPPAGSLGQTLHHACAQAEGGIIFFLLHKTPLLAHRAASRWCRPSGPQGFRCLRRKPPLYGAGLPKTSNAQPVVGRSQVVRQRILIPPFRGSNSGVEVTGTRSYRLCRHTRPPKTHSLLPLARAQVRAAKDCAVHHSQHFGSSVSRGSRAGHVAAARADRGRDRRRFAAAAHGRDHRIAGVRQLHA
jgi:hypothetical protein